MQRLAPALLVLLLLPVTTLADSWQETLYDQQRALYRLAGTWYMSTVPDADHKDLESIPARIAEYRGTLAALEAAAGSNPQRRQQAASMRKAWLALESVASGSLQTLRSNQKKSRLREGTDRVMQAASDFRFRLQALEAEANSALVSLGRSPERHRALLLQGAADAEQLASRYAQDVAGHVTRQGRDRKDEGLASALAALDARLVAAQRTTDSGDFRKRLALQRIEARWKFMRATLANLKAGDERPRIVYRYLGEISDGFTKLAARN